MNNVPMFPIQGEDRDLNGNELRYPYLPACMIPRWLAEEAYKEYSRRYGTAQSLDRLGERGGFGRWELLAYLEPICRLARQTLHPEATP